MYTNSRYDEKFEFEITIPWESNTAKGFVIASVFTVLMILSLNLVDLKEPVERNIRINSVPIVLLNLGEGDGTGKRSGNLTEEGVKSTGGKAESVLQDAQKSAATEVKRQAVEQTENEEAIPRSVSDIASTQKSDSEASGTATRDIGAPGGITSGSGLGSRGSGKGKGTGFGDIDWGGGGNRVVLSKTLPKFPNGVKTEGEIKIRFQVMADGTVGKMIPLQKADPLLEKAAMDALKKWRFNPLEENIVMEGTIPLNFVLR